MKRCPTCDKTFDDSLRFCQTDGTPLVDDAPLDPYKTIVARPGEIAAAIPPSESSQAREEDEVLQIPDESDLKKTMAISEEELRREMSDPGSIDEQVIEIPPLGSEPTPPPSPFSAPEPSSFEHTRPPIPSPFEEKEKPAFEPPSAPDFKPYPEPSAPAQEPPLNPFDQPQPPAPMAAAEWTPPPVPDANWQNQQIGQNTPFQPPPAGTSVNQTLPIISLVLGIVSLCCYISPLTGIAALITGYKGMKNADRDPQHFGGRGLAIAGMITGGIFFILGLLYWLYIIFVIGFAAIGSMGGFN
jgi:uncharacterized protein DUF4190